MAPKKGQKMSLSAFLDDATLGSWADEMESLPTAPAFRTEEERTRDTGYGDFLSRPDRAPLPPREEVPLPTTPPFTAFVGNLAFDMSEAELGQFFGPHKTVSVKIITDRDGKPKGFGYVEFDQLDGLKYALTKSGSTLSHRTVRVNVAEPPKERERGGLGGRDAPEDDKFAGNWRREGPLLSIDPGSRRGSGFRSRDRPDDGDVEGPKRGMKFQPAQESERPELNEDWRGSARGPLPPLERERKPGLHAETTGIADPDDVWTKGSKFRPGTTASDVGSIGRKFVAGSTSPADEGDWRSRSRPAGRSPTSSNPPTPVRKKLELLPRSGDLSGAAISPAPPSVSPVIKPNPFGTAKPVDVSAREKQVEERLAREREETSGFGRHPMSRESSRQASMREPHPLSRETSRQATTRGAQPQSSQSRKVSSSSIGSPPTNTTATVRPTFSFASAAKRSAEIVGQPAKNEKEQSTSSSEVDNENANTEDMAVQKLMEQNTEIAV